MKIVEQALKKINSLNKKQRDFFILLVQGLIGVAGKRTFRNLSRYLGITEHTIARQMTKVFDFVGLNTELIKSARKDNDIYIAAQDETFSTKSGKHTYGLGYFWNGSAGKAEKGLAFDTIAAIKINGTEKVGYTVSAMQSPTNQKSKQTEKKELMDEPTKIDFSLNHVKTVMPQLHDLGIKHIAADAFFAKIKYVNGVVELGLNVISKLRKDARLLRIYNGPQKARGRKKKFDTGRVNLNDFKDSIITQLDNEQIELLSCVVHSVSLNRLIKVVLVRKFFGDGKCGEAFLFSTDTELETIHIFQYYVARFQIEFIFRDTKGFTGLTDCQSRDERRIHYHINASLTALNVAKLQDHELQANKNTKHAFSMTNWSRIYHVEIVINRFISMFDLDPTYIKSHPNFNNMLAFGSITH